MNQIAKTAGGIATVLLLLVSLSAIPLQAAGTPVIGAGGIVNGAHFRAATMPGGDIAQGSMFSIFGVEIGPTVAVSTTSFPLGTVLAGVEITVTQGNVTVNAIPLVVSAGQINAIMPSNAPLGVVQVRVICNGVASEPEPVTVVETSIGIFTVAGNGLGPGSITDLNFALNTSTNTATPNQIMILWVTGAGGIDGDDSIPPSQNGPLQDFKDDAGMNLQVTVGGRPVTRVLYLGRSSGFSALDQLIVELSGDIPMGCNVPVIVTARGVTSNSATMATSADGGECSDDPDNPILSGLDGGKNASIVLARIKATVDVGALGLLVPAPVEKSLGKSLEKGFLPPIGDTLETTLDVAAGSFMEVSDDDTIDPSVLATINNFFEMPPYGSCLSFSSEGLDDIIDMGTGGGEGRPLNAGADYTLTRTSDNATRTVPIQNGTGAAILGESFPMLVTSLLGMGAPPLFLDAGSFRAESDGGAEVGAWSADFNLAAPLDWTNDGSFGAVNRGSNQTVQWSGGNSSQFVEVVFLNLDVNTEVATGVACLARPSDGSITVDSSLLSTISASTPPDVNGDLTSLGLVLVGATQFKDLTTFNAQGLDNGFVTTASVNIVTTIFE